MEAGKKITVRTSTFGSETRIPNRKPEAESTPATERGEKKDRDSSVKNEKQLRTQSVQSNPVLKVRMDRLHSVRSARSGRAEKPLVKGAEKMYEAIEDPAIRQSANHYLQLFEGRNTSPARMVDGGMEQAFFDLALQVKEKLSKHCDVKFSTTKEHCFPKLIFLNDKIGLHAELSIVADNSGVEPSRPLLLLFNGVTGLLDKANIYNSARNLMGKDLHNLDAIGQFALQVVKLVESDLVPEIARYEKQSVEEDATLSNQSLTHKISHIEAPLQTRLVICGVSAGGMQAFHSAAYCALHGKVLPHFSVNGLLLGSKVQGIYLEAMRTEGFTEGIRFVNRGDWVGHGLNSAIKHSCGIEIILPKGRHAGQSIKFQKQNSLYGRVGKDVKAEMSADLLPHLRRFSHDMQESTKKNLLSDLEFDGEATGVPPGDSHESAVGEKEENAPFPEQMLVSFREFIRLHMDKLEQGNLTLPPMNGLDKAFVKAWAQARKDNPDFPKNYGWGDTVNAVVVRLEKRIDIQTRQAEYKDKKVAEERERAAAVQTRAREREAAHREQLGGKMSMLFMDGHGPTDD